MNESLMVLQPIGWITTIHENPIGYTVENNDTDRTSHKMSSAIDSGPPTVFSWPQTSQPWQTSAWQNYISWWSGICHTHALYRHLL